MKNVSSINNLENRVPKLRFPEFSGEWETVKLSDFTERVTRKNSDNQTNLPLTISSKDGLVDQVTYFNKTVASKDMSGYYLLLNGEFAYNKSYSVGYDFGSIKRLDRYPMGALSTLYICFALKKYDSDFIKVYFDSLKWYREIYIIAAEGARNHGLLNVPTEDFFQTRHILPNNIVEQQKIASFFTLLDARIAKQRELVENLKLYKRGVVSAIFGRKKRFKDKDGNEFPMWKKSVFSELFKIHPNNTLSRSELTYSNNGVYNVHYGDVLIKFGAYIDFNNDIVPTINSSTSLKAFADTAYLQDGDVVFADTAEDYTVGKVSEIYGLNKKLALSGLHTIPCRPNRQFAPKYLGYYFNSYTYREQILPTIQGSKVSSISRAELQNSYLVIPCIEEQTAISDFLSSIDQKIIHYSCITDTLTEYKKSIMQKIFI